MFRFMSCYTVASVRFMMRVAAGESIYSITNASKVGPFCHDLSSDLYQVVLIFSFCDTILKVFNQIYKEKEEKKSLFYPTVCVFKSAEV